MLCYTAPISKDFKPFRWKQSWTNSSPILGEMLDQNLCLIHNPMKATLKAPKSSKFPLE